jgi:hypothetical protein
MTNPPDAPDAEQQIASARPILARALHALFPDVPLVDCARIANCVFDDAAAGDFTTARLAIAMLQRVLDTARLPS